MDGEVTDVKQLGASLEQQQKVFRELAEAIDFVSRKHKN